MDLQHPSLPPSKRYCCTKGQGPADVLASGHDLKRSECLLAGLAMPVRKVKNLSEPRAYFKVCAIVSFTHRVARAQCPLEELLADPYCLAPPKLGVGEFHADTDETSIEEAFRKHAGANGTVRHAQQASARGRAVCLPTV